MPDRVWPSRIANPPDGWMTRLRPNDLIWLVKEDCPGCVELPFQSGKLVFHAMSKDNHRLSLESWHVRDNGRGLTGCP